VVYALCRVLDVRPGADSILAVKEEPRHEPSRRTP
jgi:hypothetical protein